MFLYRSAAIGRGFGVIELSDEINLGNSDLATSYARVSYTTSNGYEIRGTPISHGAAVLASASNPKTALLFMKFLASLAGQVTAKEFNFMTSPNPGRRVGRPTSTGPLRTSSRVDTRHKQGSLPSIRAID